jgi:hypothetical protein
MNKDYELFTSRNAYAGFLTGVNTNHGIYWNQFNYMYEKTKLAKTAKQQHLIIVEHTLKHFKNMSSMFQ